MKVKVVGLEQHSLNPVVIITDADEKGFIPILIGPSEAQAISQGMEGTSMPRPMTHDLLKNMVNALGAKVKRIVIHDLREETYYANVVIESATGKEIEVDARPADRCTGFKGEAPIYVSDEIAARAVIANTKADEEMEEFRRFLENLSPEDFERNLRG